MDHYALIIHMVCQASHKGYGPMILLDMLVLATLVIQSRPSSSTGIVRWSWMYFTASLDTKHHHTTVTISKATDLHKNYIQHINV